MSASQSGETDPSLPWLEALRGELWDAQTILAALEDVAAGCGSEVDATWLDRRQQSDVAVYVLASGVLHRVVGPKDAHGDATKPGDPVATTVEYRATRLSRAASYRVEIVREQPSAVVYRSWTFTELGEFGSLNLQWPLRETPSRQQDPTAFANAIVKAILKTGSD